MRASAGSVMHNFQEEISFECQHRCQRRLSGVAAEMLDVSNRFWRIRKTGAMNTNRIGSSIKTP